MIQVVVGDGAVQHDDAALIVRVGGTRAAAEASVAIGIADPTLAAAMTSAIADAVAAAALTCSPGSEPLPIVALRSRKALARLRDQLAGAIAVVAVTERNARHLLELVEGVRAAGALGVQLVWDGSTRMTIERHVFTMLERARATPNGPPVVLATHDRPVAALLALVTHRLRMRRDG